MGVEDKAGKAPGGGKERPLSGMARGFAKEILIPIVLALVVIQFVIQAFKIPSASMEDSLLVGDFLLGLKFVYGSPLPFSDKKLPGFADPKPGDVLIFRYPGDPKHPEGNPDRYAFLANLFLFGNLYWDRTPGPDQKRIVWYQPKDFIKRTVAQSGQRIQVSGRKLIVDGRESPLPRKGKFRENRGYDPHRDSLDYRIPAPGETVDLDTLSLTEAVWIRSLAYQENPDKKVELRLDVVKDSVVDSNYVMPYLNGDPENMTHRTVFALLNIIPGPGYEGATVYMHAENVPFSQVQKAAGTGFIRTNDLKTLPRYPEGWRRIENSEYFLGHYLELVSQNIAGQGQAAGKSYRIRASLKIDGQTSTKYTVREKAYFMMGDFRDNSSDSRYWGLLSKDYVKAKAFIIYFSLSDPDESISLRNPFSWLMVPFKARYNRIGKLID